MRVRVLVSDLGNVLVKFDHDPAWRAIEAACRPGTPAGAFHDRFVQLGCSRGAIGSAEFHAHLVRELGLTLAYAEFRAVWADIFEPDPGVLALLGDLKVEKRVLLSNTNEIHWEHIKRSYPEIVGAFDYHIVSHECGLEKPDPAIFRRAIEWSGAAPGDHLYVDDIFDYVDAARAVGMRAIHFRGKEPLREELEKLGLRARR